MKTLPASLAAALLAFSGCANAPDAEPAAAPVIEAPAVEAPAAEAAPVAATDEGHHGEGAEGHHGEGAKGHHGEAGELTGADALRAAGNPRDVDGWTVFGADFTLTETQPLSTTLASATGEAVVRVEGTVADVCSKMGCWMVVQSGEESVRVTMKEHGFGIDRDCAGKTASLEGTLRSKPVDKEMVKHYESESANPDAAPEKGKDVVWEIVATSVALEG